MAQGLLRQCDMPDLLYDASQMINTYVSFFFIIFIFFIKDKTWSFMHITQKQNIPIKGGRTSLLKLGKIIYRTEHMTFFSQEMRKIRCSN